MTQTNPPIFRLAIVQICLTLMLAAACYWVKPPAAFSALIGGSIAVISNTFSMWWFFRNTGNQPPQRILLAAYWGEGLKVLLLVLLFGTALQAGGARYFPVLLGCYMVVQLGYWAAMLLGRGSARRRN